MGKAIQTSKTDWSRSFGIEELRLLNDVLPAGRFSAAHVTVTEAMPGTRPKRRSTRAKRMVRNLWKRRGERLRLKD